jgi:hypothetical protein
MALENEFIGAKHAVLREPCRPLDLAACDHGYPRRMKDVLYIIADSNFTFNPSHFSPFACETFSVLFDRCLELDDDLKNDSFTLTASLIA